MIFTFFSVFIVRYTNLRFCNSLYTYLKPCLELRITCGIYLIGNYYFIISILLLVDCQKAEDDDNTMWYTKQLLTIVCRRVLGFVDDHCHSLVEIVENMDRNQRRDHLYVYGVYELTAEQIRHIEVSKGLLIIKKKFTYRTIRYIFINNYNL